MKKIGIFLLSVHFLVNTDARVFPSTLCCHPDDFSTNPCVVKVHHFVKWVWPYPLWCSVPAFSPHGERAGKTNQGHCRTPKIVIGSRPRCSIHPCGLPTSLHYTADFSKFLHLYTGFSN